MDLLEQEDVGPFAVDADLDPIRLPVGLAGVRGNRKLAVVYGLIVELINYVRKEQRDDVNNGNAIYNHDNPLVGVNLNSVRTHSYRAADHVFDVIMAGNEAFPLPLAILNAFASLTVAWPPEYAPEPVAAVVSAIVALSDLEEGAIAAVNGSPQALVGVTRGPGGGVMGVWAAGTKAVPVPVTAEAVPVAAEAAGGGRGRGAAGPVRHGGAHATIGRAPAGAQAEAAGLVQRGGRGGRGRGPVEAAVHGRDHAAAVEAAGPDVAGRGLGVSRRQATDEADVRRHDRGASPTAGGRRRAAPAAGPSEAGVRSPAAAGPDTAGTGCGLVLVALLLLLLISMLLFVVVVDL